MSNAGPYIRDHSSLIELNNTLGYSADSILKLLESVKSYLSGVQDVLAKQVEYLANELKEAEQALSEAEDRLRSCEASQERDEEKNEYRPSCDGESRAVTCAREMRDECQRKYDEGNRIKGDCDAEIKLYQDPGGFLTPPGGEKLLEHLAVEHTDKATRKMQEILNAVEDMMGARATLESKYPHSDAAVYENGRRDEDKPLTDEEKKERFKNAVQNVIERHEGNYGDHTIADANRVMKCSKCGRPTAACICGMDDRLKGNIQIIHDDFSR